MTHLTLLRQHSPLAQPEAQRAILDCPASHKSFEAALSEHGLSPLRASRLDVLQLNLGKLCNQTCRHCHVDAGPDRREIMSRETMLKCVEVLATTDIGTVDLTGGAPEMNPHFRWLVEQARRLGRNVIDRCNLTILLAPGYEDLPEFLAEHDVEIVASLPCYLEENVNRQRGNAVFERSITAIRRLNELGYGTTNGRLRLTLVYNPLGPSLPPPQDKLEAAYRKELRARHGIEFNRLYTITNMPISRFLSDLLESGRYEEYLQTLIGAFNPSAAAGVMCRTTLSVDWQGRLFDCDFNQMLDLPVASGMPVTIGDFQASQLATRLIMTGRHCFGCTAGAGSSCTGAVLREDGNHKN